jgi:hypothetical protein
LALALASDYPELIENYYCRCASLFACLDESNFSNSRKQDCSAMLNQSSATNEQFTKCKMSIQRLVADTSKKRIGNRLEYEIRQKNFVEMYQIFSNTDLREKIKNIKCPTLVLLRNILKNVKPCHRRAI